MKHLLRGLLIVFLGVCATPMTKTHAQTVTFGFEKEKVTMAELDERFKNEWNKPAYTKCATANNTQLTDKEKKIFYYLNLARINPRLFASTYAASYEGANGYAEDESFEGNKKSLVADLNKLTTLPLLYPDSVLYELAYCHAKSIGEKGIETHDRKLSGCPDLEGAFGENISFGKLNALDVVMSLLIDAGVPSLGHRINCLNKDYNRMGLSVQPHTTFSEDAVLDFGE